MTDVMIDIETLATTPNSAILTIAAVKFNRKDEIKPLEKLDTFYSRIQHGSCQKLGMYVDVETVRWWNLQTTDAKYEAFDNPDRTHIKDSLLKLADFLKGCKCVWANSPNFDCVILENAFKLCEIEVPWKFWNLRDCRTVYDLGKVNLKSFSSLKDSHNALNDSYNQIRALLQAFENLKIN